jgi:hypothetical protein
MVFKEEMIWQTYLIPQRDRLYVRAYKTWPRDAHLNALPQGFVNDYTEHFPVADHLSESLAEFLQSNDFQRSHARIMRRMGWTGDADVDAEREAHARELRRDPNFGATVHTRDGREIPYNDWKTETAAAGTTAASETNVS